jgi:hypothetical protein
MKKIYYLLFVILTASCTKTVETKTPTQPNGDKGSIVLLSVNLENHVDTLSISNVLLVI